MGLILDDPASRLGVAMHHQMSKLVSHIKPLTVIVPLDRVQNHNWSNLAIKRVGVDGCRLGWRKYDQYPMVFE